MLKKHRLFRSILLALISVLSLQSPLEVFAQQQFQAQGLPQQRSFPPQSKRGKLTLTALSDLVIDGKVREVKPSTRIYNEEGLIILSGALAVTSNSATAQYSQNNLRVAYTEDQFGVLEKIWLLSASEK